MDFLSNDGGRTYNLCHCTWDDLFLPFDYERLCLFPVWSNFEIADMDFWRGEAYTKFFEYLEREGGFYYEVRTNIVLLFYFSDQLI